VSYDPALTAIAVATNDALTEHLWRYDSDTDIAAADSGDPIAHIAIELARAAHDFNTTAGLLTHVGQTRARHAATITDLATAYPHSLDTDAFRAVQQLERVDTQREELLSLYAVWRRHRPLHRDPRVRRSGCSPMTRERA
jgi:hypothetical protein